MTGPLNPGDRFGSLTIVELRRGAKSVHPLAVCVCDCGQTRTPRQSALRRGLAMQCGSCSHKTAWVERERMAADERHLRSKEGEYRGNARSRNIPWNLDRQSFRRLVQEACRYCGCQPAGGIDRLENSVGYTVENSVPCCAQCNYGKRDLTEADFLAWIGRVAAHRSVL